MKELILSIVVAYLIANISKLIQNYRHSNKIEWKTFFQNGGMPSSHTATVIAMTTGLYLETGLSYFVVMSVLFSLIIMNDATKVRWTAGEEAKIINEMMSKENIPHRKLSERLGHTPLEVAIGFVLGVLVALVVYAL